MSVQTAEVDYLYSSLASDPDLGEIVDLFVDEMPQRVGMLVDCLAQADWQQLGRYAHQMKGACGSYGFDELTAPAARLEHACRETLDETQIRAALDELQSLCQRVRRGVEAEA